MRINKLHQYTIGQGRSIVLVHGWGMHSGVWRNFAEQLAQHYRVTCIDLPGHGRSDSCADFSLPYISELLVNSVIDKNCYWLGWSLGATIVLDLAQRFPERVNALVLMAANPKFVQTSSENNSWPGMNSAIFNAFAEHLKINPQRTLTKFISLQVCGASDAKTQLKHLRELLDSQSHYCLNNLQSGLDILKQTDMRSVLAHLQVPVSVILSKNDKLVPIAVSKNFSNYKAIQLNTIDNAGHAFFLSSQQDVVAIVSRFMEGQ